MARKKTLIDPKHAERMRTILSETKLSQSKLAEMTSKGTNSKGFSYGLNQRTISKIVLGKQRTTQDIANEIHKVLPQYSVEWILGLSEYRNTDEEKKSEDNNKFLKEFGKIYERELKMNEVFDTLSELAGFTVSKGYIGDEPGEATCLWDDKYKSTYRIPDSKVMCFIKSTCAFLKTFVEADISYRISQEEEEKLRQELLEEEMREEEMRESL